MCKSVWRIPWAHCPRTDSAVCIDDDDCCAAVRLGGAREHALAKLSDLRIQPFASATKASPCLRLIGLGLGPFAADTLASPCLRLIGLGLKLLLRLRLLGTARQRSPELLGTVIKL